MHTFDPNTGLMQQQPQPAMPAQYGGGRAGNMSRTNLFIRYLPKEVDDEELVRMFQGFGAIATSMVMRDIYTGESLGTAFVRFESPRAAEAARKGMDQLHIYGKKLSIQWARREHDYKTANNDLRKKRMYKLFLRNVPLSVTTDDLGRLLSPYGTVAAVSIHADTQQIDGVDARGAGRASPAPHSAAAEVADEEAAGLPMPTSDDAVNDGTKVFVQSPESPELATTPAPRSTPPLNSLVRRIAFITFAEEGSAERALKGVHHTCPYVECDGIPFMGKLINDNVLSKKQQQQMGARVGPHPTLSPRPLPRSGSVAPFALPSPASGRSRTGGVPGAAAVPHPGGLSRSPTVSQGPGSATEYPAMDGLVAAAPVNTLYGTPLLSGQGSGYPVYSRCITPTSESNSFTPRLAAVPYSGSYAMGGGKALCSPAVASAASAHTAMQPLSARSLQSGTNRLNTNSPCAVSPNMCTPIRSQRYTHNPYAGVVIL